MIISHFSPSTRLRLAATMPCVAGTDAWVSADGGVSFQEIAAG
jgi:hypothetical protein